MTKKTFSHTCHRDLNFHVSLFVDKCQSKKKKIVFVLRLFTQTNQQVIKRALASVSDDCGKHSTELLNIWLATELVQQIVLSTCPPVNPHTQTSSLLNTVRFSNARNFGLQRNFGEVYFQIGFCTRLTCRKLFFFCLLAVN